MKLHSDEKPTQETKHDFQKDKLLLSGSVHSNGGHKNQNGAHNNNHESRTSLLQQDYIYKLREIFDIYVLNKQIAQPPVLQSKPVRKNYLRKPVRRWRLWRKWSVPPFLIVFNSVILVVTADSNEHVKTKWSSAFKCASGYKVVEDDEIHLDCCCLKQYYQIQWLSDEHRLITNYLYNKQKVSPQQILDRNATAKFHIDEEDPNFGCLQLTIANFQRHRDCKEYTCKGRDLIGQTGLTNDYNELFTAFLRPNVILSRKEAFPSPEELANKVSVNRSGDQVTISVTDECVLQATLACDGNYTNTYNLTARNNSLGDVMYMEVNISLSTSHRNCNITVNKFNTISSSKSVPLPLEVSQEQEQTDEDDDKSIWILATIAITAASMVCLMTSLLLFCCCCIYHKRKVKTESDILFNVNLL